MVSCTCRGVVHVSGQSGVFVLASASLSRSRLVIGQRDHEDVGRCSAVITLACLRHLSNAGGVQRFEDRRFVSQLVSILIRMERALGCLAIGPLFVDRLPDLVEPP